MAKKAAKISKLTKKDIKEANRKTKIKKARGKKEELPEEEEEEDSPSVTYVISKDADLKAVVKSIRKGQFSIDTESLLDEIEHLHSLRIIRTMQYGSMMQSSQKHLIEAALQNQAFRSRCTEIQMKCFRIKSNIDTSRKYLTNHLAERYSKELSNYRTIKEKTAIVDNALRPIINLIRDLDRVIDFARYVIEDIDQASYTLFGIRDTLKILNKNEMIV